MKPKVFVSSTFYDLKYVREELSNFIKDYNFEPIMFEGGDIGYDPHKPLDESCYDAMKSADMVILIIGGNYGSKASGEKSFDKYLSVTHKEFRTAIDAGIPIFTFIDSKVLTEYETFELNQPILKEGFEEFKFKNTSDVNVFLFIKEIYQLGTLVVTPFERSEDIKEFLSKQWSDMFKKYLHSLKEDKNIKSLDITIDNMKDIVSEMKIMLDGVGKKVLVENTEEYIEILERQENFKIDSICDKLVATNCLNTNELIISSTEKKEIVRMFIETYIELFLNEDSYYADEKSVDQLIQYGIHPQKLSVNPFIVDELRRDTILKEKVIDRLSANDYFNLLVKVITK